jgi:hypothetical protein
MPVVVAMERDVAWAGSGGVELEPQPMRRAAERRASMVILRFIDGFLCSTRYM